MTRETKPAVRMEDSFDKLDIRVGRVLEVELEPSVLKPSYRLKIDFGKFGTRTSVARLTQHTVEELMGQCVLAVLNFPDKQVGDITSEVLVLGVQYPKAESGDATFVSPVANVKIGSKLC